MSLTFYILNYVSKWLWEEKNIMKLMRFTPLWNDCLITFKKCVYENWEKLKVVDKEF